MVIKAVVLALIAAQAWDAVPVTEYERWDKYEYWRDEGAADMVEKAGFSKVFVMIQKDDPVMWWCFAIPPDSKVSCSIQLETTKGVYVSDRVVFATWGQQKIVPCPAVADPNWENMTIKGKLYVVAFAHFPVVPKGDVVSWFIN